MNKNNTIITDEIDKNTITYRMWLQLHGEIQNTWHDIGVLLYKTEKSEKPNFTQVQLLFDSKGAPNECYEVLLKIMESKFNLDPLDNETNAIYGIDKNSITHKMSILLPTNIFASWSNTLFKLYKTEKSEKPNFTQVQLLLASKSAPAELYNILLKIMENKFNLTPLE
jgi:hypothetical protein